MPLLDNDALEVVPEINWQKVPLTSKTPPKEPLKNTIEPPIDTFYGRNTTQRYTKELMRIKELYPSVHKINNHTLVGIEVEVENIQNKIECPYIWSYKEDGSLRNDGIEYVSRPIEAQYIPSALAYLREKLHENNIPDYTSRTSIHVHINVQDMSFKQIQVFTILYLCFESLLYAYAGKERNKSIFCVPLSHAGYVGNLRAFFSYSDSFSTNFINIFRQWHKYTGFNLNPIHTFGTIEFRHLSGTEDVEYISKWVVLILALKEAALIYKMEDLFKVIAELNTNSEYYIFASNIFKEALQYLPNMNNLQTIMEKDISHIKECFFLNKQLLVDKVAFKTSYFYVRHNMQKKHKDLTNYEEFTITELEPLLKDVYDKYHNTDSQEERNALVITYTKIRDIIVKKKREIF